MGPRYLGSRRKGQKFRAYDQLQIPEPEAEGAGGCLSWARIPLEGMEGRCANSWLQSQGKANRAWKTHRVLPNLLPGRMQTWSTQSVEPAKRATQMALEARAGMGRGKAVWWPSPPKHPYPG